MAQINNSDLSKQLIDGAKINISHENIPSQLAEKVVPVMEVNPNLLRKIGIIGNDTRSTSGSSTLVAANPNKNVELVGYHFLSNFDALSVATICEIRITLGGLIHTIPFPLTNLSILQQNISGVFPFPIRIDRNTNVHFTLVTTAGTYSVAIAIFGYYVED